MEYARARNVSAARHRLRSFFRRDLAGDGPSSTDVEKHVYEFGEAEAVRHVLRVASALDSMVVGEQQVLNQVRTAFSAAAIGENQPSVQSS